METGFYVRVNGMAMSLKKKKKRGTNATGWEGSIPLKWSWPAAGDHKGFLQL